jgi:adenylylsulfate reductase subunit A
MRFIALRCKDTIEHHRDNSQALGRSQVNSRGEEYERNYGIPKTSVRLYSTVMENRDGRGPCFLKTEGISKEQEQELYKAYFNMAPSQTLRWIENGKGPSSSNVEIEGTEPYIVGGHTASGYWVDTKRASTLEGLYAAGDVAGGGPQKYVTGALVEGEIAALSSIEYIKGKELEKQDKDIVSDMLREVNEFVSRGQSFYSIEDIEKQCKRLWTTMPVGFHQGMP